MAANERIITNFYSKKNSVALVETPDGLCIKKVFADRDNCIREHAELTALKGKRVPKILKKADNCIYMEYIEGELLLDAFLKADRAGLARLAGLLAGFISEYCDCRKGRCLADLNYRNFIICGNALYGIDFENTEAGSVLSALSNAIAFALLYDLDKDGKDYFVACLASHFSYDRDSLIKAVEEQLEVIMQRRGINSRNITICIE